MNEWKPWTHVDRKRGVPPVAPSTPVEWQRSDGSTCKGAADPSDWGHAIDKRPIVAWRLPERTAEPTPPHEWVKTGGIKHDIDKPQMDLLDPYAMEQLAAVLTFGAKKYEAHNWRKGFKYSRLIAAALRHIFAYARGEDNDQESGLPHTAHAMCCLMFLLGLSHRAAELDDRYKET